MKKVYISGPIKGHEDTYRASFARETQKLRVEGLDVISPVEAGDRLGDILGRTPTYDEYMKYDISELLLCEQIHMLRDWERSVGARCEFHVAVLCGMSVTYQ